MIVREGRIIMPVNKIPFGVLNDLLGADTANLMEQEYREIESYYEDYKHGVKPYEVVADDKSSVRYKKIKVLIDKEARFMFSATPDFNVQSVLSADAQDEVEKARIDAIQLFIDEVMRKNEIGRKLVKAAKDCFVGKRVGWAVNFNEITGIKVLFFKSLNFYAEYDEIDSVTLKRFVYYVFTNKAQSATKKRIFAKDYWIGEDGLCHITETIYDGAGAIVVDPVEYETDFEYIPCGVIANDGLIEEDEGVSEVEDLKELEKVFSNLANWDVDAEKADMNPIKYTVDIDPVSTKDLSHGAGAYWDLQHDTALDNASPAVGVLAPNMNHTTALKETLDRTRQAMNELVQVPDVSPDKISGSVASYKGLRALYWDMIIRCDEKMLAWGTALQNIMTTIIDGAIKNPEIAKKYTEDTLQVVRYKTEVVANYAIQDDEESEKAIDMQEVQLNIMSRRSYNKKWRNMTSKQSEEELSQIALENSALENTEGGMVPPTSVEQSQQAIIK